ncbi:MAG TPA: DnaB-like helicase N-terminal domain-containing protein, partial [Bacillota bacterium]|nr:DnaB-like helicase N-terminal domain-containing protein [Bacillota bacterium]
MEKKVPQNIEAEEAVLGSVFFDQGSMKTIIDKLQDMDFFSPNHQVIFRAMKSLFQEGVAIDYTTLIDRLESQNLLTQAGGADYVTDLINAVPSAANLLNYVNIVKDKSILRKIQDSCRDIVERAYQTENAPEFIDEVEKEIIDITKEKRTSDFRSAGEIAENIVKKIAEQAQSAGSLSGLDTRYRELNHYTFGLQPSDLIIIAARPSIGKTAFALNIALNIAKGPKKPHVA